MNNIRVARKKPLAAGEKNYHGYTPPGPEDIQVFSPGN
jgi:hypothetical protein